MKKKLLRPNGQRLHSPGFGSARRRGLETKLFLILALLLTALQGTRADNDPTVSVWDGHSTSAPVYYDVFNGKQDVYVINTAAELAYLAERVKTDGDYATKYFYLNADLDMSKATWTPIGTGGRIFDGIFEGNNHTIKIEIIGENINDNQQGLFEMIGSGGVVQNLHVSGTISVNNSRQVGGIAGSNSGIIYNCWVSADVASKHYNTISRAELGGIAGFNSSFGKIMYCCMTGHVSNPRNNGVGGIVGTNSGQIQDVTFLGEVYNNHKQDNIWVGTMGDNAKLTNNHATDLLDDNNFDTYYNSLTRLIEDDIYKYALREPFAIDITKYSDNGEGVITASATRSRPGKTITVTKTAGTVRDIDILRSNIYSVDYSGDKNGTISFTMPMDNVNVQVYFTQKTLQTTGTGTSSDPYIIDSEEKWNQFAHDVSYGIDYKGQYLKLTQDISVTTIAGQVRGTTGKYAFSGNFDGGGHTITANITSTSDHGTALFGYIIGATIENLNVAGTISGGLHAAALVGMAGGTTDTETNTISNCKVSASVSGGTHIGGLMGHALDSKINISRCVFSGTMSGGEEAKGAIVGWGDNGTKTISDCLYLMSNGQNTDGLDLVRLYGGSVTVTNCYKTTSAGSYGVQVSVELPTGTIYKQIPSLADGNTYYMACTVSIPTYYQYNSGGDIAVNPIVTAADGTILTKATDYTYSPETVKDQGTYTLTITGKSGYGGSYTQEFWVTKDPTDQSTTLPTGSYSVNANLVVEQRIVIQGDVVLNIGDGYCLEAKKGIELSQGNSLTINGPGELLIENCDKDKSGIGAYNVGTLTINSGIINVTGGRYAAALGGNANNAGGGSITINGGTVNATCGENAAAIGGGYSEWEGKYGVCGNITINGGQVTAKGDDNTPGIGPGYKIGDKYNSGTLTISWTNATDFIYSDYYNFDFNTLESVNFAFGKQFVYDDDDIYSGPTVATSNNILTGWNGIKIEPNTNYGSWEGNPIIVSNSDEWNAFAETLKNGTAGGYNGKFLKLTNNINVTTMAGSDANHSFMGTFDGDNHTLEVSYQTSEQYAAPFHYTYGATIKNLKTAGTINTSSTHAGGVVGRNGTKKTTLYNVSSSATISSTYSGNAYHGGLMGYAINAEFDGCVFTGSLIGTESDHCSGLLGQKSYTDNSLATFTNCLFAPAEASVSPTLSFTFAAGSNDRISVSNCYHTETLFSAQGKKAYALTEQPSTLDELAKDYGLWEAYTNGIAFGGKYYVAPVSLSLADRADNTADISSAKGKVADVTLQGRTIYLDGKWNTLCLPFNLEIGTTSGIEARTLTGASIEGSTLNLTFSETQSTLIAGTPYIIKCEKAADYIDDDAHNLVSPMFEGVTIDAETHDCDFGSGNTRVRFLGTYKSLSFSATDKNILMMGGENTLYYPAQGAGIGAQRAYFKIGDDNGEHAPQLTTISMDFSDGDSTTGIIESLAPAPSQEEGAWYSLDGRRLAGKPTQRGVYIHQGNKIIIK